MMLDVLGKRLEFGFLQKVSKGALAVPTGSEILPVVFAQVFDLRGGMFVVDLSALVTCTTIEARILRCFAHVDSSIATARL